jgi:hypothetical protein
MDLLFFKQLPLPIESSGLLVLLLIHNILSDQGLTFAKAQEMGIATAHLPINEYVAMATRKVLAVNHGKRHFQFDYGLLLDESRLD